MNHAARITTLGRISTRLGIRASSSSGERGNASEPPSKENKSTNVKITQLQELISGMNTKSAPKTKRKHENSDLFYYATNKKFDRNELKARYLEMWEKFSRYENERAIDMMQSNGFNRLIMQTEEGLLWKYPIDNEQGLEAEQQVPFEDHVFFDQYLQDLPKDENIRAFMELVVSGLAKNNWITVDRKREVIRFYKEYFDGRRQTYKDAGCEI